MVHGKKRTPYWIDRRLTGLARTEYHAIISFRSPIEPEDSQYGESRLMTDVNNLLGKLKSDEQRGSKPRCHWLTHGSREQVANRLTVLAEPWGTVSADDQWIPEGFNRTKEAQLHQVPNLLSQEDCNRLRDWWLAVQNNNPKTPNWDIISTCTVGDAKGVLLVEAKAHNKELKAKDKSKASSDNFLQIGNCMEQANNSLADYTKPGWALSHMHHYQMSNRFAWSWKLMELGYSVILVYLGFLNAEEMREREGREKRPLTSHAEWECLVKSHSETLFPKEVWDRQWSVYGHLFVPRILSCKIRYDSPIEK